MIFSHNPLLNAQCLGSEMISKQCSRTVRQSTYSQQFTQLAILFQTTALSKTISRHPFKQPVAFGISLCANCDSSNHLMTEQNVCSLGNTIELMAGCMLSVKASVDRYHQNNVREDCSLFCSLAPNTILV